MWRISEAAFPRMPYPHILPDEHYGAAVRLSLFALALIPLNPHPKQQHSTSNIIISQGKEVEPLAIQ